MVIVRAIVQACIVINIKISLSTQEMKKCK